VGQALARRLEWAHLDTDRVIEADLGRPIQEIFDGLGREAFISRSRSASRPPCASSAA
jgi:shikimate kinase